MRDVFTLKAYSLQHLGNYIYAEMLITPGLLLTDLHAVHRGPLWDYNRDEPL